MEHTLNITLNINLVMNIYTHRQANIIIIIHIQVLRNTRHRAFGFRRNIVLIKQLIFGGVVLMVCLMDGGFALTACLMGRGMVSIAWWVE